MDTRHERLADLADDAPTGGAPAAELWARGRRDYRVRVAGVAAAVLVVGIAGTGIGGVRLADGGDKRSDLEPTGIVGVSLPIEYLVGGELPDLRNAPGKLATIWLLPRANGGAPGAVGLVAETGRFGTLGVSESRAQVARKIPGS